MSNLISIEDLLKLRDEQASSDVLEVDESLVDGMIAELQLKADSINIDELDIGVICATLRTIATLATTICTLLGR